MATIDISLNHPVQDGEILQFIATEDSGSVTGLNITYPVDLEGTMENKTFTLRDGHKNSLSGKQNIFVSGALVTVVIGLADSYAYVLNGDTNVYLEGLFTTVNTELTSLDTRLDSVETTAAAALPKAGGKLTGKLILTSGVHYGTALPTDDYTAGRIFLKKV